MINFKLLPHELKQEHKTRFNNFEGLTVAHKQFTWSGGEIPHIGRYGGHIFHNFGFWELDARVQDKASKRLGATKRAITAIIMHSDKTILIKT